MVLGEFAHSLDEIGLHFELTRERVRQIKEKALRRLKDHLKTKYFDTIWLNYLNKKAAILQLFLFFDKFN